ncbi:GDSL-type esterase/lipase family protein [Rhodoferax sp. WC2427]|uniref:GDSL-type esterase/lipase family protein n=1 Tax=Rhodoferax sp. WC2427 TaxID=3234144 RepID=UPI0034671EB4
MSKLLPSLLLCAAAVASCGVAVAQSAGAVAPAATPVQDGPTPFPKDFKDWPGKGAIRVFGWMNDNRKAFWQERARKQGSVVFAGDSLVGGWSTLAKDLPGLTVANRGIGSETTRGLLFRFQEDVLDLHPKAIVLLTGSNDLSALQDVQLSRSNLTDILDKAEKQMPGVPVVLCTVPPRNHPQSPVDPRQVVELNKLIASVAQGRKNVVVLDLHALLVDPDGSPHAEYFGADKLHISPLGYQHVRDALLPVLKQFNLG